MNVTTIVLNQGNFTQYFSKIGTCTLVDICTLGPAKIIIVEFFTLLSNVQKSVIRFACHFSYKTCVQYREQLHTAPIYLSYCLLRVHVHTGIHTGLLGCADTSN